MRIFAALLCIVGGLTANAQPTNAGGSLESQLTARLGKASSLDSMEIKPNEIVSGRVTLSGIAVQLLKGDNPLQLINPLAPARYGSPEDNVLRDSFTGTVTGLKIFSIRF